MSSILIPASNISREMKCLIVQASRTRADPFLTVLVTETCSFFRAFAYCFLYFLVD